jgi:two-component system chemotaxis response regulator CheY
MNNTKAQYTILLVEDDTFLVDMYTVKFMQGGHTIESSFGGEDALKKLRAGLEPDAIVTDLIMPQMNGFDFLEAVKQEGLAPHAALIVLSNQSEKEDREHVEQIGVDGDIVKANATPSEVLAQIEEIIRNKNG